MVQVVQVEGLVVVGWVAQAVQVERQRVAEKQAAELAVGGAKLATAKREVRRLVERLGLHRWIASADRPSTRAIRSRPDLGGAS